MFLVNSYRFGWSAANAETTDWVARVVINGGATPSLAKRQAVDAWFTTVKAESGLAAAIKSCCLLVGASLTEVLTPLIDTAGNDPWTNTDFVSGDLTANGLVGDGVSTYLDTGVVLSADTSLNSVHYSLYCYDGNNDGTNDIEASEGGAQSSGMYVSYAGNSYFDSYGSGAGRCGPIANSAWQGFLVGSRTASNSSHIYKANAGTGWASIGNVATNAGTRPTISTWMYAQNSGGGYSSRRFSFASIGAGLTSAQGQALFNATQTALTSLGGGYR